MAEPQGSLSLPGHALPSDESSQESSDLRKYFNCPDDEDQNGVFGDDLNDLQLSSESAEIAQMYAEMEKWRYDNHQIKYRESFGHLDSPEHTSPEPEQSSYQHVKKEGNENQIPDTFELFSTLSDSVCVMKTDSEALSDLKPLQERPMKKLKLTENENVSVLGDKISEESNSTYDAVVSVEGTSKKCSKVDEAVGGTMPLLEVYTIKLPSSTHATSAPCIIISDFKMTHPEAPTTPRCPTTSGLITTALSHSPEKTEVPGTGEASWMQSTASKAKADGM